MRVAAGTALAAAGSIVQVVCSVDIGEKNPRFDCQYDEKALNRH